MDCEFIGVRHVDCHEIRARFHQVGDESHVTRKSVELGYYEGSLVLFCSLNRLGELGALRSFAALNLGELGNQLPRATVQIGLYGLPLSFQAKTRSALLFCTHTVVGDESTFGHQAVSRVL
jgi:hypothetical protein